MRVLVLSKTARLRYELRAHGARTATSADLDVVQPPNESMREACAAHEAVVSGLCTALEHEGVSVDPDDTKEEDAEELEKKAVQGDMVAQAKTQMSRTKFENKKNDIEEEKDRPNFDKNREGMEAMLKRIEEINMAFRKEVHGEPAWDFSNEEHEVAFGLK